MFTKNAKREVGMNFSLMLYSVEGLMMRHGVVEDHFRAFFIILNFTRVLDLKTFTKPDARLCRGCLDDGFLRIVFLTGMRAGAFATTAFLTASCRTLFFFNARGVLTPLVQDLKVVVFGCTGDAYISAFVQETFKP